ncbi:S8 family peptidase [Actinomadura sp. HBU206391]|uniref:S8 family peptidase n=1 Tax=Actinomadura sp. HBU206391 TaxID=2731692 RepID=UPI00164EF57C|nr:S8/S53 family peptidase [Actinomadura sp. HBU206391]MBC6462223.1 S8/S53 family peptidase [Actinomadura sp. HBU206391]
MSVPEERGDPKFLSQLEALRDAAGPAGIEVEIGYNRQGAPVTAYQKGHLLVRDADLGEVLRVVPGAAPAGDSRSGVTRVDTGGRAALDAHAELGQRMRRGAASLNHIVSIAPTGLCPGDEPAPAGPLPNPAVNPDDKAGAGVVVKVIDTGLVPIRNHSWLAVGVTGGMNTIENAEDPTLIREYAGHGTFIAGILKCVAPAAWVDVSNALPFAGAVPEDELGDQLLRELPPEGERWPDIISISAGASTGNNAPLVGLERFVEQLGRHEETVLVAAAGNHGDRVPFWPAALAGPFPEPMPGVVSVGALSDSGTSMACFSNHGPWVSVYAPGERLVNAFIEGRYKYRDPQEGHCRYYPPPQPDDDCTCMSAPPEHSIATMSGMARWSGTSFATPMVAGMIAVRMSKTKESSRQAAAALLAGAGHLQGVGPVLIPPGWFPA